MNRYSQTEKCNKPATDSLSEKNKSDPPVVAESELPTQQQAVNRMPARADNLFTLGKRHV